jgi:acyl carrier protein
MAVSFTQEETEQIRHNFRRCREGTADAIIDLRHTGDSELIPTIVRGIVWRYVREETQPAVEHATPETPLGSLGIDSLTMMEIVLDVQDALNLTIEDADLKQMKTIGDVIGFLQQRFAQLRSGS